MVPPGYHGMNSFCKSDHDIATKETEVEATSRQVFTFEFQVPDTNVKLNRKVKELKNIKLTNVEKWIADFRTTLETCEWIEAAALKIVRVVISPEIYEQVKSFRSIDTTLDALLTLKYPAEDAPKYLDKIKEIKQIQYYWIDDYAKDINETIRKLAICKN